MSKSQNNYKYDFLGTFLRYIKIPYKRKNKFVCSYFVGDVLEQAGIHKFNKETYFLRPKDFENIDNAKEIYSGLFSKYTSN